MTRYLPILALLCLLATPCPAMIFWTGKADDNFWNPANWDFSRSNLTTIAPDKPIDDDAYITSAVLKADKDVVFVGGHKLVLTNAQLTTPSLIGFRGNNPESSAKLVLNKSKAELQFLANSSEATLDSGSKLTIYGAARSINVAKVILGPGAEIVFLRGNQFPGLAEVIFHRDTNATFLADFYNGNVPDAASMGTGPRNSFALTGDDFTPFAADSTARFTIRALPK